MDACCVPTGTPDREKLTNYDMDDRVLRKMRLDSGVLNGLVILCLLFLSIARAGATGALEYRVSYRGIFSAGTDMQIADLRLESRMLPDSGGLSEAGVEVSSQAYPLVENLFPIRYRFRSWTTQDQGRLLGFETYESTRKLRHRLYLRDDSGVGVQRYDLKSGEGRGEMAQLETGVAPVVAAKGERLLDRLGLLQRVRQQNLHEQAAYRFVVTNGRERLIYEITVVAAQSLALDGVSLPAWKLRFDGRESGGRASSKPAHRPVYVWLSQAPGHIPLRVDSRQAIGLFRIELKDRPGLDQIAGLGL